MPRRTLAFIVFALVLAAGCVRLGFWQLSRLQERQAVNARIAATLEAEPAAWGAAVADSATARYRRVQLTGRFDYTRELVLTSRGHGGAPGVHVLTPLVVPDGPAVLVNRGWAYAADGMTVDLSRWREGDHVTVQGYLEQFVIADGMLSSPSQPRGIRRLVRDSIEARLGERIAPFVLVQQHEAVPGDTTVRLVAVGPPTLGPGSHRSYAIQWFAFALIAVVGAGAVAIRQRR